MENLLCKIVLSAVRILISVDSQAKTIRRVIHSHSYKTFKSTGSAMETLLKVLTGLKATRWPDEIIGLHQESDKSV